MTYGQPDQELFLYKQSCFSYSPSIINSHKLIIWLGTYFLLLWAPLTNIFRKWEVQFLTPLHRSEVTYESHHCTCVQKKNCKMLLYCTYFTLIFSRCLSQKARTHVYFLELRCNFAIVKQFLLLFTAQFFNWCLFWSQLRLVSVSLFEPQTLRH